MTLILAWIEKHNYIAIACDGKGITKNRNGDIVASVEHLSKLTPLAPHHDLVLAVGGDSELGPYIHQVLKQPLEVGKEELFEALEYAVPFTARAFVNHKHYEPPQDHGVLLFGYDAAEQELRGVGWGSANDWQPVELRRFVAEGYDEAKTLALSLVDRAALKQATPEQACELLAGIIRQVAARMPERVNGHVRRW